ncbi:MAG: MMPL family transporter [Spirochaetota bacterium]
MRVLLEKNARTWATIVNIESVFAEQEIPIVISGEGYLKSKIFDYVVQILVTILPIVIVSVLVPIFVIVLGSADGLHITSHVMDNLSAGKTNREAIVTTLRAVGMPVVLTTLTTMAGFLSQLLINSRSIQELGVSTAIGILIAGLATWIILPAVLIHQKPLPKARAREEGPAFRILTRLRGWPSILIALGLVVVFVPGLLSMRAVFFLRDLDDETLEEFLRIVADTSAAIVPIFITLVTLFGVMGYARIDLSVITGIMSGLTIGVGIDYAIHYVSLLRQSRARGDADPSSSALGYVATPVIANALGLAVGFTALLVSPLQIHVTLTILMWTTMLTAALLSLTLLPTITGRVSQ